MKNQGQAKAGILKSSSAGSVCIVCEGELLTKITHYEAAGRRLAVYRCLSCGHVFKHGQDLRRVFQRYYEKKVRSRYSDEIQEELAKSQVQWLISEIGRHCSRQDTRVVEIGAGGGWFVQRLRQVGYCDSVGFEPEVYAVENARTRGVEASALINAFVDDLADLPGRPPQVVCLMHVLEHMVDPARFLLTAKRAGVDLLYIEVPNGEIESKLLEYETSTASYSFEHLHAFSRDSIHRLTERAGYSVARFELLGEPKFYDNQILKRRFEKLLHELTTRASTMTEFRQIAMILLRLNFEFLKVWIVLKMRYTFRREYCRSEMPVFRMLLKLRS